MLIDIDMPGEEDSPVHPKPFVLEHNSKLLRIQKIQKIEKISVDPDHENSEDDISDEDEDDVSESELESYSQESSIRDRFREDRSASGSDSFSESGEEFAVTDRDSVQEMFIDIENKPPL